ncbi:MAG: PAS domain-containing protein [Candidatus Thiodiazotropha sp. (ex Dulcina madagascariensis)]|nr:PAS domain-containing protein [Candidatus Thiodiazotropha sp. (ex Dulcina madagascariensis)]
MRINRHDRDAFTNLLKSSEDQLIERILYYAERQDYTQYTSTLKEAWRLSIEGLSKAMIESLERSDLVPEFGPEEDFIADPGAQFGMQEARRHRARGVNLAMFLGLMKYYRQAYLDLLEEITGFDQPAAVNLFVRRFYDRTELAYCTEWAGTDPEAQIKELSSSNLHLANEKNKYLTLFESLSSPVLLCDEKGKVDNYNNAAGRLLLGSRTSGDRYYAEKRHDLDPPALQEELAQLMSAGKKCLEVEKTFQTPAGEKTYDVQLERMLDVSQKFSGYTILFNDITDRLRWAKQLEGINRKQQALIDDLQRTRWQLVQAEKMAAIGQLASGVAHEINTPTQYIGDNIRFMQEAFEDLSEYCKFQKRLLTAAENGGLSAELVTEARDKAEEADLDYLFEEIPHAIRQSQQGVERIATIVSAMKEFARPGTKEKTDTDINGAIMSTVNVSASQWKYHADIETDLAPDLPSVRCVPGELNQAVLNIIVNAAHAIADVVGEEEPAGKGRITIRTHRDGDWVAIDISDTGSGIPDEIKSKIFDPFFTTRDVGKGTGQGLTIAYSAIVEKHAGTIDVESAPGGGTTFAIRLPIAPAERKNGG